MKNVIQYLKLCYYIGAVADLLATIPLISPKIAELMFGLVDQSTNLSFQYTSRIGASLMLGWALLLIWGSFKPIERKALLLLTVFPVVIGLAIATILAITSGLIYFSNIIPLLIFYIIIIPMYITGYAIAKK